MVRNFIERVVSTIVSSNLFNTLMLAHSITKCISHQIIDFHKGNKYPMGQSNPIWKMSSDTVWIYTNVTISTS